jgi:hypothetical protein
VISSSRLLFNALMKAKKLKESIEFYKDFRNYFYNFATQVENLNLDKDGIQYPANEFRKMDISKLDV